MSDAIVLRAAVGAADMATVAALFREYQQGLGVSLCFQDFERELAELPGAYAPPGGIVFLAERGGQAMGVGALRALGPGIAEMKRLYVRDAARGLGLGRKLAHALVAEAKRCGYASMRLDTLPHLTAAIALYADMGFKPIAAYNDNPIAGVQHYELAL
ncbi:MAG: GNAT family N-acetyltransferase [Telmatospirillum sp.]|nr:GNAT family N-acetyltransferase [Telmatospirillum sp.]